MKVSLRTGSGQGNCKTTKYPENFPSSSVFSYKSLIYAISLLLFQILLFEWFNLFFHLNFDHFIIPLIKITMIHETIYVCV